MKSELENLQQRERALLDENQKLSDSSNKLQQELLSLQERFQKYQIDTASEKEQLHSIVLIILSTHKHIHIQPSSFYTLTQTFGI
jgi:siroheme synthase (precorrin-2 oxidase/ferrochelatase)